MRATRVDDPTEFLTSAAPLLERSEARHNVLYGIGGLLVSSPDVYPDYRLWLIEDAGAPVAAALRTLPYNLIVAEAVTESAVGALVEVVAGDDRNLPGILGVKAAVESFVRHWTALTGDSAEHQMNQGVFALDRVEQVPTPPGRARPATDADRSIAVEWVKAFTDEALADVDGPGLDERHIDQFLSGAGGAGLWIWERDGFPVSMSGHGSRTPNGIRVSAVYTPVAHRRNGYATALVAAQSAWLLAQGFQFCFLHTDLGNPTSNAIYRRIGYRQVGESAQFRFVRPD